VLIFTYTSLFVGLLSIILSIFVFNKKPRINHTTLFSVFAFVVGLWIISVFISDILVNVFELVIWTKLATIFGLLTAFLFCVFALFFRYPNNKHKKTIIILSLFLIVFSSHISFLPAESVYIDISTMHFFDGITPTQGQLSNVFSYYLLLIFGYLVMGIIILWSKSSLLMKGSRKQIIYITIGFLITSFGGILFDIILPIFGYTQFYSLGTQFTFFFVLFIAYAIIKYQFLDIRIVIQRGVIFTVLLVIIIGIYEAGIFTLSKIISYPNQYIRDIVALFTIIVGIFAIRPIENYFRKITDHFFFKHTYDYSMLVEELSKIINAKIDINDLLGGVADVIQNNVKSQTVEWLLFRDSTIVKDSKIIRDGFESCSTEITEYLLSQKDIILRKEIDFLIEQSHVSFAEKSALRQLKTLGESQSIDMWIPIVLENFDIAYMTVGSKLSGDSYTDKDMHLFATLSYQVAVALEKAFLYEEVKQQSVTLEKKVMERTKELQALQEHQKRLIVNLSHNMQTPLTILKSNLQALRFRVPEDETLDRLEHSIDTLSKFIYDLMKLYRFEDGEFKKDVLDLSDITKDFLEDVVVLANAQNVIIITEIESGCFIEGDKESIQELLINIMSNALKYIANEKKIHVSLYKKEKMVQFMVRDTGIGIPKKDLPHLFDRFYRSDNSRDVAQGSGIGLALCKQIVDKHNATIRIESDEGKGTTVIIEFNLYQEKPV
jgi:signal transduction histidine kinase